MAALSVLVLKLVETIFGTQAQGRGSIGWRYPGGPLGCCPFESGLPFDLLLGYVALCLDCVTQSSGCSKHRLAATVATKVGQSD